MADIAQREEVGGIADTALVVVGIADTALVVVVSFGRTVADTAIDSASDCLDSFDIGIAVGPDILGCDHHSVNSQTRPRLRSIAGQS